MALAEIRAEWIVRARVASWEVDMSIPRRDLIATLLVATATLIYALWLIGPLNGLAAGSVAIVFLALGFVASASAVVPGFAALLA